MDWNTDSIRDFAADLATFERGQQIPAKDWSEGNGDGRLVWGTCTGSRSYEVSVELPSGRATCGCPARNKPCKHAVSLLLAYLADPSRYGGGATPRVADQQLVEHATKCLELARAKQHTEALEAAIALWRGLAQSNQSQAVGVASAVEELGRNAGPKAPKPEPTDEWFYVAATHQSKLLRPILESINLKSNDDANIQIDALATWPDDPRLSAYLCDLLKTMRVLRSENAAPFWVTAFHLLARIPDQRSLTLLESLDSKHRAQLGTYAGAFMHQKIEQVREELRQRFASPGATSAGVQEAVHKLLSFVSPAPSKQTTDTEALGDELLRDIFANPQSEEARHVYSDLLSERGDPRGEFIALQLARAAGSQSKEGAKREKALLKKHRDKWLGTLAAYVLKKDLVFEGGFIDTVQFNHERFFRSRHTLDDPGWSTVRALYGAPCDLILAPGLKSLREVELRHKDLVELAQLERPQAFTRLIITGSAASAIRRLKKASQSLTHLKHLEIGVIGKADELAPLCDSSIFQGLSDLTVSVEEKGPVGGIVETIAAHKHVEPLFIDSGYEEGGSWRLKFSSGKARFDTLECTFKAGSYSGFVDRLDELLGSIDPSSLTKMTVSSRSKPSEDGLPDIRQALQRFVSIKKTKFPKGWAQ